MNILPKKRWHVRTKDNIARVRRDEAEAAEKEKQERLRIENADREARLNLLKEKSKQKLEEAGIYTDIEIPQTSTSATEHINLFADLDHAVKSTNKEHDNEAKDKKEEYEKKIGYLTYLGQDTNEALKKRNWYELPPEATRFSRSNDIKDTYDKLVLRDAEGKPKAKEPDIKDGELAWKAKQKLDPLNAFKHLCPEKIKILDKLTKKPKEDYTRLTDSYKHKHKKHKKYKKSKHRKDKETKEDKEKKLQKLREARIKREMQEKRRTEQFLKGKSEPVKEAEEVVTGRVKPKYNSQFNPELARQNYR